MSLMKLYGFMFVVALFISNVIGTDQPATSEFTLELDRDLRSDDLNVCTGTECNAPELMHDPELIRSYVHSKSAVGIQIKNSRSYPVYYFWVNTRTKQGQFNGVISPFGVTATISYIGHTFYVVKDRNDPRNKALYEFTVDGTANSNLFIVPIDPNYATDNEIEYFNNLLKEKKWALEYEKKTGYPYLSYYNSEIGGNGARQPPVLTFWDADFIGQKHVVESNETYWTCIPDPSWTQQEANDKCRDDNGGKGYIEIDIEVISLYPKIFKIMGTNSPAEAKYIINYAQPGLLRSRAGTKGGMVTDTRTSFNTWISRDVHPIISTMYNRAADILGLERDQMKAGMNSEQLQVLHYDIGQEYSPHHDFGSAGTDKQRVMTLLFYLNDVDKGGHTYFPKAMGTGMRVHPGKGNSALFYSILPDGNADDLSIHAGAPVEQGEKWACNFWIWDPHIRGGRYMSSKSEL